MRFRSCGWLLMALLIAGLWLAPTSLLAQDRYQISVDTILALRDGSGIDSRLQPHVGELQSMFNYTAYRLLGSQRLNLAKGESGTVSLPGQRQLTVTPRDSQGNRAHIALQMTKKSRTVFQTQVQLLNRGSLFVGGPTYQQGNLIFRISGSY